MRWRASTALVSDMALRAAEGWQRRVSIAALPSSQAIVVVRGTLVAPPGEAPLGEWFEAGNRYASETHVVESHLSDVPEDALRECLTFVRARIGTPPESSQ